MKRFDEDTDLEFDFENDPDREKLDVKKLIPVFTAIALIVLVVGIAVGAKLLEKYSYSKETLDLAEYYHIENEWQTAMIVQDEILDEQAAFRDGTIYIPLSFVQEKLNDKFYYDKFENLLLFTTPTEIYEIPVDSSSYTVAGEAGNHEGIIWILQDEVPYIALDFLSGYANFGYEIYEAPNRIQLYIEETTHQTATIKKNTAVRYQGGIKSDILKEVKKGDTVSVLETMETWSKVKTQDAIIGYVENKRLSDTEETPVAIPDSYMAPVYTSITKDYPINMTWHQVTNSTANSGVDQLLANTKGINTISPTWFFLNDNNGNFTSIADKAYVDNMHARGIEVWALIDNFTNNVDIARILSTTTNRKNLIAQLVGIVKEYGIDGINVDFEQIPTEAGPDYVQFLRELSVSCRNNGIVLSADNYVPTEYTAHYGRKEQGEVLDYFVIMGYDEHYSGSAEAGSVASINYVRQGIENTVKDVPAEKVINGIPFYTRIWKLSDGVTSEALSMTAADNYLSQYGVTATWDETTCQNYASFEADGATYQIWLEDTDSISAKLNVMSMYPLAGVAHWKLGLEKAEIWDVIAQYLNTAPPASSTKEQTELEMTVIE